MLGNRVINEGCTIHVEKYSAATATKVDITESDVAGTKKSVVVDTQTGTHQRIMPLARMTCFGVCPFVKS